MAVDNAQSQDGSLANAGGPVLPCLDVACSATGPRIGLIRVRSSPMMGATRVWRGVFTRCGTPRA